MFLNLWNKSRNEEVVQDKLRIRPPGPPLLPVNQATPSPQKTKRRRDDSSSVFSHLEAPPFKRRIETMSHVEVPSCDKQVVASSPSFSQAVARIPAKPIATSSRANMSQQTATFIPPAENPRSPLRDSVSWMEGEKPFEGQGTKQITQLRVGTDLASLREAVESQFNLEILLKHRELQLIDREIAKCQIGLEQLRRCTFIPYPAISSNISDMQAVSNGSGPVYHNSAPHAPAWGVTNGPYTQHYARWLLQDPAFDDTIPDEQMSAPVTPGVGDRSTRGVRSERQGFASKSRSSRATNNARLTALPDGYPVAKEEKGPCIVTRSSDNKRVKLVCLDPSCRRSDFNSAQGFINHCRIQHQRAFASHDAAINQCGEEIDEDAEGGNNEPQGTTSVGLVHPLVRLAFSPAGLTAPPLSAPAQPSKKRKASTLNMESTSSLGKVSSSATGTTVNNLGDDRVNIDGKEGPKQPLKASSQTPYLSRLFARMGKGGDLDDMVKQAMTKADVDFEHLSDEEEEDDTEEDVIQSESMAQSHSTHGGMRPSAPTQVTASNIHRRPFSTDGAGETPTTAEYPVHEASYSSAYNTRIEHSSTHADPSMLDVSTSFNLSPNSTDPHPAPSLVSDDGDGDYENMHSDSESPSDLGDERATHHEPEVIDHDGIDLGESSGLSIGHTKQHHHSDHHGPPSEIVTVTRRSRVASTSTNISRTNDERHVSFASPSRELRKGPKAKNPH